MATHRQRRWIGGIILFALAVGIIAITVGGDRGPVHEGKSLQEWFDSLSPPDMYSKDDPNVRAIVAIGSDAVPFLMRELCVSESPWAERFRRLWSGLGLTRREYLPARFRRERAYYALLYLGPKVDAALPELLRIAQEESNPGSGWAIALLGINRSNPAAVIPVLQKMIAAPGAHGFHLAIHALISQGTNARPALPRLKEIESDARAHMDIRLLAAHARMSIDPTERQSLDFLVAQWENADEGTRSFIEFALRGHGTNAMPALPAMRKMVATESNVHLRVSLSNSIRLLEIAAGAESSQPR